MLLFPLILVEEEHFLFSKDYEKIANNNNVIDLCSSKCAE